MKNLDQKGQVPDVIVLAIGAFIVIVILFLFFAYLWGQASASTVEIGSNEYHDCSSELSLLASDYGVYQTRDYFFINENDFYLVKFGQDWLVPFDGRNCEIIENVQLAKLVFQTSNYKKNISDIPSDFFAQTRDCFKVSVAKGMSNICQVTGLTNTILEFPITQIVTIIPTSSTRDAVLSISNNETIANAAGKTAFILKKIDGSNITTFLQFTEDTSCALKETPQLTVWQLSNFANGLFLNNKSGNFFTDSIPKLVSISDTIVLMENTPFTPHPPKRDPNDVAGILWDTGAQIYETTADVLTDVITTLSQSDCTNQKQSQKYLSFKNILLDNNYENNLAIFNNKLQEYVLQAQNAINARKIEQSTYAPNLIQWIILPTKSMAYFLIPAESDYLFENQQYESSTETAKNEIQLYSKYWEKINLEDIIGSIVIWIVLIAIILLIINAIKNWNQGENYPPINNSQLIQ